LTDSIENIQDFNNGLLETEEKDKRENKIFPFVYPLMLLVLFIAGLSAVNSYCKEIIVQNLLENDSATKGRNFNFLALLAGEQFAENLRDTVYTDKDKYLELRIDQQYVYVHYRDGRVKKYPVSSGNKFLNKGIESRPGLFAIFIKEELHLSSQFNDAKMFYYMPFNMGIGFHGLAGTGYYGNLGVRPSSHGCIRMRNEDVKALFKETEVGTLVLAHRGESARVVAFAPDGFQNEFEYTKDDYMSMLAYNLNSLYEGKYFIDHPKRFIINSSLIPKIGFFTGNNDKIPEKQLVPSMIVKVPVKNDRMKNSLFVKKTELKDLEQDLAEHIVTAKESSGNSSVVNVSKELIDKLAYNKIGVLPYFPPNR
jgi:hypothetical protein